MIRDKLNVLTNMFFTTICNCNKLQYFNEGITKLTEIAKKNGYAILEIQECMRKALHKINTKYIRKEKMKLDNFLKIPNISEDLMNKIRKTLNNGGFTNIQIIKNKSEKLSNTVTAKNKYVVDCKTKCEIVDCMSKHVVYKMTCKICGKFYIGMTNSTICKRFNQHKTAIKKGEKSNAMIEHFAKDHCNKKCNMTDIYFEILEKCDNNKLTAIKESLYIEKLKPEINRKQEYTIFDFIA